MSGEKYISRLIVPAFWSIHRDICQGRYVHYWLKGGRGSGKSSFISLEIILGMIGDENANAVVLRKVANSLRNSVFEQLWWAICQLGVEQFWERKVSIPELVYKKSGQRIVFHGMDDPRRIKSVKFQKGYCKYIWFEEVDEFLGAGEIRTINQSLMRGGDGFTVFYSFNPPKSQQNWVNQQLMQVRLDTRIHHSTYLDMPEEWLGRGFLAEANHMKTACEELYRHEYLGEAIGSGAEVFRNLEIREILDEEIAEFTHINRGLDWGYAVDPLHYTVNHYDNKKRRLYVFFEIQKAGMSNREIAEKILEEDIRQCEIICDSAEPKSIAELCEYGIRATGAKKGPGSISFGMRWLRGLEKITIDPRRCPNTAREFSAYSFEGDGRGGWKDRFPDRDNHAIDAVRYSCQNVMHCVKVR